MDAGTTPSVFEIARSLPTTDTPEFEPVTTNVNADNCSTDWNDVNVGFSEKFYRPESFGWRGPVICADNLRFDWQVNSFMDAYLRAMRKNVTWTIENRLAAIYDHYVPKAVAGTFLSWTAPGTGFPGQTPSFSGLSATNCDLTQPNLDQMALTLMEEGATTGPFDDGWTTWAQDGPVFTLQIGLQASHQILRQNIELRNDYRYATMGKGEEGSPIIKRLAASKIIGNFRHLVVEYPPRYNWDGSTYVRVPTWIEDPEITNGDGVKLNPEWISADYEAVRVLSPDVYESQIVTPITAAGGGTSWMPRSYAGEWKFITGGYRIQAEDCLDPLEKYGRHFAEYKHAPKPLISKYGRLLIFRRCPLEADCIQCAC